MTDGSWDKTEADQVTLAGVRGLFARGSELFFTEGDLGLLRRYSDGQVTTIMGKGTGMADYVQPEQLRLATPEGVVVTSDRHVIVAEKGASKVRMLWNEAALLPPPP